MKKSKRELLFWISLLSTSLSGSVCSARASGGGGPFLSNAIQGISRRGFSSLSKSFPALSIHNLRHGESSSSHPTMEVAVKKKKRKRRTIKIPNLELDQGGFYYGIAPKTLARATQKGSNPKKMTLSDSMFEALEELRVMRQEMETMRKEMQQLKRKMIADGEIIEDDVDREERTAKAMMAKRRRQRESEKLAVEIEQWAQKIIAETEEEGWKEVACSKMMKKSLDPTGRTTAFIKVRTILVASKQWSNGETHGFWLLWFWYE